MHYEIRKQFSIQPDSIPHVSSENAPQILALIQEAQDFCQNIKTRTHTWEGVDTNPHRAQQIKDSLIYHLKGFHQELKNLDKARWDQFLDISLYSHTPNQTKIRYIIETSESEDEWTNDALQELPPFLDFLDTHTIVKPHDFVTTMSYCAEQLPDIVGNFLQEHVGHHHHRVHMEEKDGLGAREGLDGEEKTCPVALAPDMAVRYFTYAAAEYLLMQAIAQVETMLVLQEQQQHSLP